MLVAWKSNNRSLQTGSGMLRPEVRLDEESVTRSPDMVLIEIVLLGEARWPTSTIIGEFP